MPVLCSISRKQCEMHQLRGICGKRDNGPGTVKRGTTSRQRFSVIRTRKWQKGQAACVECVVHRSTLGWYRHDERHQCWVLLWGGGSFRRACCIFVTAQMPVTDRLCHPRCPSVARGGCHWPITPRRNCLIMHVETRRACHAFLDRGKGRVWC